MSDILRTVSTFERSADNKVQVRRFKKGTSLKLRMNGGIGSTSAVPNGAKQSDPFPALEELLQCGICLEKLLHPRMLPCQHTFCLICLKSHVTSRNLRFAAHNDSSRNQRYLTFDNEVKTMSCPICQRQVSLTEGIASLEKLPKNLYLESFLKVVEESPSSPKVMENYRCINCQMVSAQQEQVCQHCMQIFCSVCWNAHLVELNNNLLILVRQLNESEQRLRHKYENFLIRCETLEEKVGKATKLKIETLKMGERQVLEEVDSIKKEAGVTSDSLLHSIERLMKDIEVRSKERTNQVTTYLNLHKETSKILDQVGYFGEARITFDPDAFKLEQMSEGIYNDEEEPQQQNFFLVTNPFESIDSMTKHYKARSFMPKLVWNKCPRPAGLGIPPWDENKLYIAATDSHYVLILDKSRFKLVDRLTHADMVCPAGLAFWANKKEVFVSDKWKHWVHVFSSEGAHLRSFTGLKMRSPDGIAIGPNEELVVCDTGNDRILLVDPITGEKLGIIGAQHGVTQLNFPTSVAVFGDDIIVADSGNNRVKRYNLKGELLQEIGSFGKNPGQFRSAEVVAVDPKGFVLVGDAGNARIQVFTPDGNVVKIFGSKSGFRWVSGLLVTPRLEIITSDNKMRSLKIF
ncbi:tripartite motif-containing protein 2-like [Euwallacea fornicatus]|uniref:tripartite motif-containing protein 2-like n=1 Tax=Euwallacea fornicatus TaxID=995702 RepID=UPI00338D99AD